MLIRIINLFDLYSVITGVKFVIKSNTLQIQIKEGELLPFGQVKSENDWTPVKNSDKETVQFKMNCRFIISRQHVSPNQVLVAVQIRQFTRDNKCFYTIVAHGRNADLLEGDLLTYRSQYLAA